MAAEQVIDVKRIGISRVKDPRLRISGGLPVSVRKLKKRQQKYNARGMDDDLPVDHDLCYGFDYDRSVHPYKLAKSYWGDDYDFELYGRLGLYCYNFQKGTNLKFVRWEKYISKLYSDFNVYLTLEAMDPALQSLFSFQTLFIDAGPLVGISFKWLTLAGRIKCNEGVDDYWIDNTIDDFYKGDMPKWVSDDDLAADNNNKYYVLQESELHENEWWLHFFAEIGFYSREGSSCLMASPRLEINRAVVETREEEATREPREKLKAENAIFYISYKYNGHPSTLNVAGDYQAIIRKTMDGKPGHMCLEVAE